jgi:hypothetical protein
MPELLTPPARMEPPFRVPFVDADGTVTPEWQTWLAGLTDWREALEARVAALEAP